MQHSLEVEFKWLKASKAERWVETCWESTHDELANANCNQLVRIKYESDEFPVNRTQQSEIIIRTNKCDPFR